MTILFSFPTQVQLQLLTAVVKLFLKRPADTQELVQHVLSLATQDSDNPDLRWVVNVGNVVSISIFLQCYCIGKTDIEIRLNFIVIATR